MLHTPKAVDRRHRPVMVALFFLFISAYLLTYNGRLSFNDELQMVDITGSYVDFGDNNYDLGLWYVWTNYGPLGQGSPQRYPLPESPIEPVQSLIGIPFYWLSEVFSLGTVHTMWLVNIVVSAAACVLMFRYVLLLGYDLRVAIFAALMLGFCTILWAYTRTFLREPFTLFILLFAAYMLEKARRYHAWWWLVPAAAAFVIGFYTKNSAIMLLPALVLILTPDFSQLSKRITVGRMLDGGLMVVLLVPLVLVYTPILARVVGDASVVIGGYALVPGFSRTALHSYLLSIGGSIWGTSPILLAAIPGAWLLIRRQQRRYIWVMVISLLGISIGHALTAGQYWGGGVTWPPRFIMPVLPFVLICALPVFQKLFSPGGAALEATPQMGRSHPVFSNSRLPWLILVCALVIYSLWWQIVSVSLSWFEYPHRLPPEAFFISEWSPGLNTLRYMRPVMLTPALFEMPLDFVWVRLDKWLWPVLFLSGVVASAFLLHQAFLGRVRQWMMAFVPLFCLGTMLVGLETIRIDPRYLGDKDSLHQISAIIEEVEQPNDVVLLNVPDYHEFFLNYAHFDEARVVSLPVPPGERGSFEESPEVFFDDPIELLEPSTSDVIKVLTAGRERIWLLMNTSPFFPWSIRPTEHYMALRHYPLREINTEPPDPTVRLLEYATIPREIQQAGIATDAETDFLYGEMIHLLGFSLPFGQAYQAGEALPIALFWQADTLIEESYTVAFFLADSAGAVVAQGRDSAPVGGFEPTTMWKPETPVRDNRALRIPENLGPGSYQLWVRLYSADANGELVILPVAGERVLEGNIAVLPVEIQIKV